MNKESRSIKRCPVCGEEYRRKGTDTYYCEICAKEVKQKSTVRVRVCRTCGAAFSGGPRASYCPVCREERKKEDRKKYKERQKNNPSSVRKIGSIQKCESCRNEYVLASGRQKYCYDCQRQALLDWQKEHKKKIEYHRTEERKKYRDDMRKNRFKICAYCGKDFTTTSNTNACSDDCKKMLKKINQAKTDWERGKRSLKSYTKLLEEKERICKESEKLRTEK